MKVAIVHFHLRRGGVTRVVETTVGAFAGSDVHFAVLSGEAPAAPDRLPCPVAVVPGLGYDDRGPQGSPAELADAMCAAARSCLGGDPDVWHIHNHSLGKNASLPGAIARLARDGHRFLLHLHDFPEDGRPANYRHLRDHLADLEADLYPVADRVRYAGLTGRDVSFLEAAGSPPDQTYLLANPIALPEPADTAEPASPRLFLYPTRAIRRKNLGEFLLWAALGDPGDDYAVTLAPENPRERPAYEEWVWCANRWNLPVRFEAGADRTIPFPALVQSATALVTTSIAEGFGLAYLEPWLLQRPVAGRNLPEITRGFADNGIRLDGLYDRLDIPMEWIGRDRLKTRIAPALEAACRSYGREPSPDAVERAAAAAAPEDTVDFGRLDEAMQRQVIQRLLDAPSERDRLAPARLAFGTDTGANRDIILDTYHPSGYARRLRGIYTDLAGAPPGPVQALSASALLDRFLDPERFCLLRA